MKSIDIKAVKRESYGKKESKKLQKESLIPCTISGNGDTVHFSVATNSAKPLIYTPESYIINFDIEGKKETAVMREVQYHPVKEQVLHMDFFRALPDKEVAIDIPVKLEGNPAGVRMGGKLTLRIRKLRVKGLIKNLPDNLVIDISKLKIGQSIFVGDLEYPNLTIVTPKTTAICAVNVTRAARSASSAATEEEEAGEDAAPEGVQAASEGATEE